MLFALQALAMGVFTSLFFGFGFRLQGGELAALVVGPSLITPSIYLLRSRGRG